MKFKNIIDRHLPKNSFARNVGVLSGGTALTQAVGVLTLPLITRLYTPADFSTLAIFTSIVSIASVAICLRLEIAIPMPEKDEDAANLLALALAFCTILSTLAAVLSWLFGNALSSAINHPNLEQYALMMPLGIWLSGIYTTIQFWFTRKKRFPAIVKTRISQTFGSVITQLGFGLTGISGATGLIIGQIISLSAGILGLIRFAWRNDESAKNSIRFSEMKRVLKAYQSYPKYSTFEALANIAAIQAPIIIIGAFSLGPEAGYLLLAMKAASIPMGLIGGAISQVYLSQAPLEYREGKLADFTLNIIKNIIKIGAGPIIFIGIASPIVMPLIFGNEWKRAGIMIAWMTPWFVTQLIVSPISMALHVTRHQSLAMANQFFSLILRVGLTLFAAIFYKDLIFEYYATSSFIAYIAYFSVIVYAVKIKFRTLIIQTRKQIIYCTPWIALGVSVHFFNFII
ncbi:lipopolysaccharide biosynthesis protein [Malikia spinosa]|uniref:lipopolysaccharide biosynthesis protein n=1 Tax=Malikia spinosa TaxID=86180 RepID=UPI002FD9509F